MMSAESKYWPRVSGGRTWKHLQLGSYAVQVDTDLVSPGKVRYMYVLYARDSVGELRLCVASEWNERHADCLARGEKPQGGSHFMGVFTGEEHLNLGSSDRWSDLEAFTERALEVVREQLGLDDRPLEL